MSWVPCHRHVQRASRTERQDLLDQLDEMEEDLKRLRDLEKELTARNLEHDERCPPPTRAHGAWGMCQGIRGGVGGGWGMEG